MRRLLVALIMAASAAISIAQQTGGGGGAGAGGGGGAPTGAAGGALSGTYPNPSIAGAINPSSTGATTPGTGAFTTLSASSGVSSTSDGVHVGEVSIVGNTTNPSVTANTFNIFGPALATFTAYSWQVPSAAPNYAALACVGSVSSSVSQITYCPQAGSGAAIPTGPNSSTSGDLVSYTGTGGQQQDSGIASANVLVKAPLTSFSLYNPASEASNLVLSAANAVNWVAFTIPAQGMTVTHFGFNVNAVDATTSHHYDICLWNSAGTMVADLGAHAGGSGWPDTQYGNDVAIAQSSVTLPGGTYFAGWSGDATTLNLSAPNNSGVYSLALYGVGPANTTTAGQCGNVTVPSPTTSSNDVNTYLGFTLLLH